MKMLVAFLKSKDDNMILLTSNLFLNIVDDIDIDKVFFEENTEKIMSLLQLDPSFRFITCLKLSKLYYLLYKKYKAKYNGASKKNLNEILSFFKKKIANMKKILAHDHLSTSLISSFKTVGQSFDTENFFEKIK